MPSVRSYLIYDVYGNAQMTESKSRSDGVAYICTAPEFPKDSKSYGVSQHQLLKTHGLLSAWEAPSLARSGCREESAPVRTRLSSWVSQSLTQRPSMAGASLLPASAN